MPQLIFLNGSYLGLPVVIDRLQECAPQHDWISFNQIRNSTVGKHMWMCRSDPNVLPLRNDLCRHMQCEFPRLDPDFSRSFAEITDQRCLDLWQSHNNRPWIIGWSGGIDSTVILTSIMRNLDAHQRENISVACNSASMYEYPWFYEKVIKPNFRTVPSNVIRQANTTNPCYVIKGELADQLVLGLDGSDMVQQGIDIMQCPLRNPDDFLKFMTSRTDSRHSAEWAYDRTIASMQSQDFPIETYRDLTWWIYFNFNWTNVMMRSITPEWIVDGSARFAIESLPYWFGTVDYQNWSRQNLQVIDASTEARKQHFKDYIYEYTRDPYYWVFKTKVGSSSIRPPTPNTLCLLDDFSVITDLDQILDLLPDYAA